MAFNKIQPQQIQLPTFFSESGNLLFTDNVTGVTVELSKQIETTGPVNFISGLEVKGSEVMTQSSGISLAGSGNASIGQSGASVMEGVYNVALGGMTSTFDTTDCGYNASINTQSSTFSSNTKSNMSIGGNVVTFNDDATGSIIIASTNKTKATSDDNKIFLISDNTTFEGGNTKFRTNVDFEETNSLNIGTSAELNVSGATNLHGATTITGDCDITGEGTIQLSGSNVYMQSRTDFSGVAHFHDRISRASSSDEFYDHQQQKAYTMDFVTGGSYNNTGHFIVHHSANGVAGASPQAGETGSILLQISGVRFEVDGTWRSKTHVIT